MDEFAKTDNQWSEDNSSTFLDLGEIFVPARAEQIATLLHLLPASTDEQFTVVELASGEGILAQAILEHFPHCHYIALDGSAAMRQHMEQRLTRFSNRLSIRPFSLAEQQWRTTLPTPLRVILSSLCIHHLPAEGKRQLFRDMAAQLAPGGALLLADIIEPATQQIAQLFAHQYDDLVRAQSMAVRGNLSGYEQFRDSEWNYFVHDYTLPESYDQPSRLYEQLVWLQDAGLSLVDCFWMRAGHAIYGGYK